MALDSTPSWQYRLLVVLISPVFFIHLLIRTWRDGGLRYSRERLGFYKKDQHTVHWVHAASVGEVLTVLPLLSAIQKQDPNRRFLISTNTPTGAAVLSQHADGLFKHVYLPLDFAWCTARFFRQHNIVSSWIVETEIWPWLFAKANAADIPIKIINARLNPIKGITRILEGTIRHALSRVEILARTPEDADRYRALGNQEMIVSTVGNLKFANDKVITPADNPLPYPYMLAASTHSDEEVQLAQLWLEQQNAGLLVIVPRHPERGDSLRNSFDSLQKSALAVTPDETTAPQGLKTSAVQQRSKNQLPDDTARLYIADTVGELNTWYAHADAVFVGGSLIPRGGQNMLEPARLGKPIVVGPHTDNFKDVMSELRAKDAIVIAEDAAEVIKCILLTRAEPDWAKNLAERARECAMQSNGVINNYLDRLV